MSSNPHEQPEDLSASLLSPQRSTFERAFVHTVLKLLGRTTVATTPDMTVGKKYLYLYDLKVAVEQSRWGQGFGSNAQTHLDGVTNAFMLVRFGSVLPPTQDQLKAFHDWQSEGRASSTWMNCLDAQGLSPPEMRHFT